MSAPKPELTPELMDLASKLARLINPPHLSFIHSSSIAAAESLVREVVEIVARIDAELAMDADTNYDAEQAILSNWKLERKP